MALDDLSREKIQALIETAGDLAAEIDLGALLERILERAGALTDSPDASVILHHGDGNGLYFAAATGDRAEWVLTTFGKHSAKRVPIHGSKAGQVFSTGELIIENAVADHFLGVDEESRKDTESMVCVPLTVGSTRLGVMQLLNKRRGPYTASDGEVLLQLAGLAAVAIRNAQLVEDLLAHSGFYSRDAKAVGLREWAAEFHRPAMEEVLTVLFADMRGFTQLIQSISSPASVQKLLNEFVSMLAREIIIQGGIVNKFLGDGVMALFRGDNHTERAVRAAFRMIDRFSGMSRRWNDQFSQQLDFLDVGVGIVTDRVTLGAIGSETVRDFTAIGPGVNLAAAFERHARNGNRVLANHLAYVQVADMVQSRQLDDYLLTRPDQTVGIRHKCYVLEGLKPVVAERVFISHSSLDRERVERALVAPLKELGIATWVADDIKKGAHWTEEIRNGISQSTWMLVVVSENSSQSDWVRTEVDMAVALGRHSGRIVPVTLDDTPLQEVNEYLVTMQAIDGRHGHDIHAEVADLIRKNFPGSGD
ncbi:MAG TPA: TIR domain-containing protein [Longimicrobiales bacterium]|nr:TIR domain-containing protein [Longimicrobiales bacterium]